MIVYVFRPNKRWNNFGGLLILALQEGMPVPTEIFDPSDATRPATLGLVDSDVRPVKHNPNRVAEWVLETSFHSPDVEEGVVAWNYNDG